MQSCKSNIESDVVIFIPLYAECKIDTFLNNGGTPSTSMTEVALNSVPTPAYLKNIKYVVYSHIQTNKYLFKNINILNV